MSDYVISLDKAAAADADSVGPKAANLAALARPACRRRDAFGLNADADWRQIAYAMRIRRRSVGCRSEFVCDLAPRGLA